MATLTQVSVPRHLWIPLSSFITRHQLTPALPHHTVAGPVNTILKGYVYKPQADADPEFATFLKHFSERFSALVFAGTVAGMLVFGVLSDRIGRKSGMIFASIWLTIWSVISAGAWGAGGSTKGTWYGVHRTKKKKKKSTAPDLL